MPTIFTEIAMQPMTITEGGRSRTVPRAVALMLTLWMQALKGNPKAWTAILHYLRDAGMLQAEPDPGDQPLSQDDQALIGDYLKKTLHGQAPKKGAPATKIIKNSGPKVTSKKKV